MQWTTSVSIPSNPGLLHHRQRMVLLGSCFTDNIGRKLREQGFSVMVNPHGVLYNPLSIERTLRVLYSDKIYRPEDLHQNGELYFSFDHHTHFSSLSAEACLSGINDRLVRFREDFSQPDVLILSFGTARVYEWLTTDELVANCHKLPAREFRHRLVEVDELSVRLEGLISWLRAMFPKLIIIFTVSPVRHWKDGAHANQISKAHLLLSIEKVIGKFSNLYYFPSYEVMLDELRDYRFYADDLLHPSAMAVNHLYNRFAQSYFTDETLFLAREVGKIAQAMQHRVFFPESEAHRKFKASYRKKIQELQAAHPYLDLSEAAAYFSD